MLANKWQISQCSPCKMATKTVRMYVHVSSSSYWRTQLFTASLWRQLLQCW